LISIYLIRCKGQKESSAFYFEKLRIFATASAPRRRRWSCERYEAVKR